MTPFQHEPSSQAPWTRTMFDRSLTPAPSSRRTETTPDDRQGWIPSLASPDCSRTSVRWDRAERTTQLGAGGHTELGKQSVQVRADRAVGEVQALADLAVRETLCRKLRDPQLLPRQLSPS